MNDHPDEEIVQEFTRTLAALIPPWLRFTWVGDDYSPARPPEGNPPAISFTVTAIVGNVIHQHTLRVRVRQIKDYDTNTYTRRIAADLVTLHAMKWVERVASRPGVPT